MTATLSQQIQQIFDSSSGLLEDILGEAMHPGYFWGDCKEQKGRRKAQNDFIEELLQWGEVQQAENILDVGCGIGGSSPLDGLVVVDTGIHYKHMYDNMSTLSRKPNTF